MNSDQLASSLILTVFKSEKASVDLGKQNMGLKNTSFFICFKHMGAQNQLVLLITQNICFG